ncbi:SusD family protein [Parapedobacter composti]|uniref:SusD family protein n=1 Tax=Parapedobacter composti TaxID=623281 RepID=A0A1I1MFN1_9SPHI|nr:RagB/SusD family nutrient uptake outer membrane protein [Parapedobacter composti]SFC84189.1 SusD family protein [Parapedobacter composti]
MKIRYDMTGIGFHKALAVFAVCLGFLSGGCEKYLNEPSDKSLAIITSLDDLQALFDHQSMTIGPNSHLVSADNYYLLDNGWESLSYEQDQRLYTWAESDVFRPNVNDWEGLYTRIYRANTVLEHLPDIERTENNQAKWDDIRGQALFFRALSFLDAVQIWSVAYDASTAQTDTGIPLRLEADFNAPSVRASVQQTYDRIISDLQDAIPLLPVAPVAKVRPSKPAAYGLLARTYLWMRNYPNALRYADSCLMLNSELIDYNELNASANFPMPRHNVEVIFERGSPAGQVLAQSRARIPESIYGSFDDDDLRRMLFFRQQADGLMAFRGSYFGSASLHTGVTTDEMYLMRAECLARDNNVKESMQDMNVLLETRWRRDEFVPFTAASAEEALLFVLEERRKQLLFRGLRWMDIKRLNKEGADISLTRTVKGQTYTLPANSPRFALPLPDDLLVYFR